MVKGMVLRGLVMGLAVVVAGCATSKNVMHTATFGLVGEENPDKAAEKERQQAEKQAAKQAEQEEKAAEKAEQEAAQDANGEEEDRSLANKMTFGLIGKDDPEAAERKRAEKEAKAQAKAERKAEKQAAKQAKKEAEAAEKAEKQAAEQAAAESEADDGDRQMAAAEAGDNEGKRGFWNKATFGLIGDGGQDETEPAATLEEAPAEAATDDPAPAETDAAGTETASADSGDASAEETVTEEAAGEDDANRPLLSKLTFGLAGGDEEDWAARTETAEQQDARRDAVNQVPRDHRKLADEKFETAVSYEPNAAGRTMGIANRVSYSKHGYGITDLGNLRIAVEGMTFDGTWRSGGLVVDATERGALSGRTGMDNRLFAYEYVNGTTSFTFGTVAFEITEGVLTIGGETVPLKEGRKLVVVSPQGAVQGVYDIGPAN